MSIEVSGRSWGSLGPPRESLGLPWKSLGRPLASLGLPMDATETTWAPPGNVLGCFGGRHGRYEKTFILFYFQRWGVLGGSLGFPGRPWDVLGRIEVVPGVDVVSATDHFVRYAKGTMMFL